MYIYEIEPAETKLFNISDGNVEIAGSVVGADILDHLTQERHIGRILSVFDPFADQVAEDPTEVFMSGVGRA